MTYAAGSDRVVCLLASGKYEIVPYRRLRPRMVYLFVPSKYHHADSVLLQRRFRNQSRKVGVRMYTNASLHGIFVATSRFPADAVLSCRCVLLQFLRAVEHPVSAPLAVHTERQRNHSRERDLGR